MEEVLELGKDRVVRIQVLIDDGVLAVFESDLLAPDLRHQLDDLRIVQRVLAVVQGVEMADVSMVV